jgi:hypothetical protein
MLVLLRDKIMNICGLEIRRSRKRRRSRRRTPEEIIAREEAKCKVWANEQLYKLAKDDPAVMREVLSAHLGREIRPTTLEDRLKTEISEKVLDLAIQRLETDPEFARKYINAMLAQTLGLTPEGLAAYSAGAAAGKREGRKQCGIKAAIDYLKDLKQLKELVLPRDSWGGAGRAIAELLNSKGLVELVKAIRSMMGVQSQSSTEAVYAVTLNGKTLLMPATMYREMADNGNAPPLVSIGRTRGQLGGQDGVTDRPNHKVGGMVVKAIDDVASMRKQPSAGTLLLLRGFAEDIDLATHSDPDKFVDALRTRPHSEGLEFLEILAGIDYEATLRNLSEIQEDDQYVAIARHFDSPEARLWLNSVIGRAKTIVKGTAKNEETDNSGS